MRRRTDVTKSSDRQQKEFPWAFLCFWIPFERAADRFGFTHCISYAAMSHHGQPIASGADCISRFPLASALCIFAAHCNEGLQHTERCARRQRRLGRHSRRGFPFWIQSGIFCWLVVVYAAFAFSAGPFCFPAWKKGRSSSEL